MAGPNPLCCFYLNLRTFISI